MDAQESQNDFKMTKILPSSPSIIFQSFCSVPVSNRGSQSREACCGPTWNLTRCGSTVPCERQALACLTHRKAHLIFFCNLTLPLPLRIAILGPAVLRQGSRRLVFFAPLSSSAIHPDLICPPCLTFRPQATEAKDGMVAPWLCPIRPLETSIDESYYPTASIRKNPEYTLLNCNSRLSLFGPSGICLQELSRHPCPDSGLHS